MASQPTQATPKIQTAPPQVRILGQYTKDVSFESPHASDWVRNPGTDATVQIDIDVTSAKLDQNIYECSIEFKARASRKSATIYNIEISYAGTFEITNFPTELMDPILNINCPSILFPFLRNLVGSMTLGGGFPPLWLDPLDWASLHAQRVANQKAKAAA